MLVHCFFSEGPKYNLIITIHNKTRHLYSVFPDLLGFCNNLTSVMPFRISYLITNSYFIYKKLKKKPPLKQNNLLAYFLLFLLIWLAQLGDPSHDLGFKLNYVEIDLKWLIWLNESKHYSIVLFETWFNYKKLNKNDKIRREIWKKK